MGRYVETKSLMMYLADDGDTATICVFGSKAGAPTRPDLYDNLTSTGHAQVEVGTDTYPVTMSELLGEERDRLLEEPARGDNGFADHAKKRPASARSRSSRSDSPRTPMNNPDADGVVAVGVSAVLG